MRALVLLLLIVLFAPPSASAEPSIPLRVEAKQRAAAHVGLAFGLVGEGIGLTSALVFAVSGESAALGVSTAAHLLDGALSAPAIAGFEGTLRDGTLAGHQRGAGVGFLQNGLHGLAMGSLLLLGTLNMELRCPPERSLDCGLGFQALFLVPQLVADFALGTAFTAIGAVLLARARAGRRASAALRVAPNLSVGVHGAQGGLAGVF